MTSTDETVVDMADAAARRGRAFGLPAEDAHGPDPAPSAAAQEVHDQETDLGPAAQMVRRPAGRVEQPGERRGPALPAWATRAGFRIAASNALLTGRAHLAYRAVHVPVYVFVYAPRGGWRAARVWAGWVAGDHTHMIRQAKRELRAADKRRDKEPHHQAIAQYRKQRREHRRNALLLTAGGLVAVVFGTAALAVTEGALVVGALVVAVVTAAAVGGRPHRPATPAVAALPGGREVMLGQDSIVRALIKAKVISEAQAEEALLLEPVHKDGNGLGFLLELPPGVEAAKLLNARTAFAAALRKHAFLIVFERETGRVGHEGVVRGWIGSRDPFAETYRSPLLKVKGAWDTWRYGVPLGVTGRGRGVAPRMNDLSALLGGRPRSGKSMEITNILVACLLDPLIRVRLVDGKGAADYDPLAAVLDTFFKLDPARLLEMLRLLVAEMEEAYEVLSQMGKRKLDEEVLASGRIRRTLVVVDEFRIYTTHKKHGKEIDAYFVDLASRGPAVGIHLVIGSQRTTTQVVSGLLRTSIQIRIAFHLDNPASSNATLGEGMAGAGFDASALPGDVAHRGMAILDADGADPITIKGYAIDEEELTTLTVQAYAVRDAARVLPGQWDDPIENQLFEITGISSAAGGPTGRGRTSSVSAAELDQLAEEAALEEIRESAPTLTAILVLAQKAAADGSDWVPLPAIAAELHSADADGWPGDLLADDAAFGRALRKAMAEELEGLGLDPTVPDAIRRRIKDPAPGSPSQLRGYLIADLYAAVGLDAEGE